MARSVSMKALWLTAFVLGGWACTPLATAQEQGVRDFPGLSAQSDWPWWRGPSRNGIAPAGNVPTRWSDKENVIWKTPVPGRGHSSPIVVGNQVFLTTADEAAKTQSVVAFDRRSGKQLWKTDISEGGFPARIHSKNTHATPSVACDGENLYVVFFHHNTVQATALGLNGQRGWQRKVADLEYRRYEYGFAPSPIIYRGTVIVTGESDTASFIAGLDRKTGKTLWETPRPKNISYSTPSIGFVAGRDQMLMSGAEQIVSYDPNNGRELWKSPGTTAATCGTMVWDGNVVIASGGYPKAETIAIVADGSAKVLWKNSQKCYEQSILAHQGFIYALTDNGILFCWQVSDGKEMWKQRLKGPVSASPVLAGGHIIWANELGTHYVFKPNPEKLELVAENTLGDESMASPAVSNGQLFLRVATNTGKRQETLYCIGK